VVVSKHGNRTNSGNVVAFDIEFAWTRDTVVDLPDGSWEVRPCRPAGKGWIIADARRERRTQWRRVRSHG
jgi:hypothetical protein